MIHKQTRIIGLVGPKGSGKGIVAAYLKKHYGARVLKFVDLLNDILDLLHVRRTRINQINLGLGLRRAFSPSVLAQALAATRYSNRSRLVVIDGIRFSADYAPWRHRSEFTLIALTANLRRRFQRIRRRGETAEEKTLSYAKFLQEEKLSTERAIARTSRMAHFTINANGSKQSVYRQVDRIAASLGIQR